MDTLYIGDIPSSYKYAQFSNDYVTLYDKPSFRNETATYYRIYFNTNGFFYSSGTQTFGNTTSYYTEVPVSNSVLYREDFGTICSVSFFMIFGIVFLVNIVTSMFKKGGLLGGLL